MSSTQQEWLERLRAVHSKNGAADSKKHGQHAGPDGFAARQGTLDSKVLGKRAGPGGFMGRKKKPVVATAKVVCTEGALPCEQIIELTQWSGSPLGRLGTWHAPKNSKIGRVTFSFANFNAIQPVIKRTVNGRAGSWLGGRLGIRVSVLRMRTFHEHGRLMVL